MSNIVVKLTEYKALVAICRVGVILFSFFSLFVALVGNFVIGQIGEVKKTELTLLREVASITEAEKNDHEKLNQIGLFMYGNRK